MRIRKVRTRTYKGRQYFTHQLLHAVRTGDEVHQVLLTHLGARFAVPKEDWKTLCWVIMQRLQGQQLFPVASAALVARADEILKKLLTRERTRMVQARLIEASEPRWVTVDVADQEQINSRTTGIEQVALWALEQIGFRALLTRLRLTPLMQRAVVGQIVARMAHPASERETYRWLCEDSALQEYLDTDFSSGSHMQLYRASDTLVQHREAIESHLYETVESFFGLGPTVTLLDLTNTYLEGSGTRQSRARRGHSKEKRSDCPLITLALVLDGHGFVQRSRANVCEFRTLQPMLEGLNAPADAIVVMDRGIATEANLAWLQEEDRRYLVVSRERKRIFDAEQPTSTTTRSGQDLQLYEVN